ncbi:MAG: hypothetical protein RI935_634 [Candidatus Parcubacteria bacterium]|jgi:hypothetical protein
MQTFNETPHNKKAVERSGAPQEQLSRDDYDRVGHQVSSLAHFLEVTGHNNAMKGEQYWSDLYAKKGSDFKKLLSQTAQQSFSKKVEIGRRFLESEDISPFAKYLETLPLMANKEGRLGAYVTADVQATAKFDDAGNFYVDHIVTLRNKYDYSKVEKSLHPEKVRKQVSFLVDTTTNLHPEGYGKKVEMLKRHCLDTGKKASVLGYVNEFGIPKLSAPKVIVGVSESTLNAFSKKIRLATSVTANGMMITSDRMFDDMFRDFFFDYIQAALVNAEDSVLYINELISGLANDTTSKQRISDLKDLRESYQQIVDFIKVYKVTPVEKEKTQQE